MRHATLLLRRPALALAAWALAFALAACSRTYHPEYRPQTVVQYQYSKVTVVQPPAPTWNPALVPATPGDEQPIPTSTSSQLVPPPVMSSRLVPPPGANDPPPRPKRR